jgi:hypothetical protein
VVCDGCRVSIHYGGINNGALSGLRLFGSANAAVDGVFFRGNQGDGIHAVALSGSTDNFTGSLHVWGSVVVGAGGIEVDQGVADIERTIVEAGDSGPSYSSSPLLAFPSPRRRAADSPSPRPARPQWVPARTTLPDWGT